MRIRILYRDSTFAPLFADSTNATIATLAERTTVKRRRKTWKTELK